MSSASSYPYRGMHRMLRMATDASQTYHVDDLELHLSAILRSPISEALNQMGQSNEAVQQITAKHTYPFATIESMLLEASAPVVILDLIKTVAAQARNIGELVIPKPVTTAIYFLCIAAALRCDNRRITSLSDADIRNGLRWVRQASWIMPHLRALAEEAQKRL